jgi:hypothetical protein
MLNLNGITPTGLRVVGWLNRLSGLWLITSTSRPRRLAMYIFESVTLLLLIYSFIFYIIRLFITESFLLYMLTWTGVINISHSAFSSALHLFYKKRVISIITEANYLMKNSNFQHYQYSLLQRVSKQSIVYMLLPMLSFMFAHSNTIYHSSWIMININASATSTTTAEEQKILLEIFENEGSILNNIMTLINFAAQTLSTFKIISMDTMFLCLEEFVRGELQVLKLTIDEAMLVGTCPTFKRVDFAIWIEYQRRISGYDIFIVSTKC